MHGTMNVKIILVIKSTKIKWAWHMTRVGEKKEKQKEKHHSEDIGVEGKIILNWVPNKDNGRTWFGLIRRRTGKIIGLS